MEDQGVVDEEQMGPEGPVRVLVASAVHVAAVGIAAWLARGDFDGAVACVCEVEVERAVGSNRIDLVVATAFPDDPPWVEVLGRIAPGAPVLVLSSGEPEDDVEHLRSGATGVFPLTARRLDFLHAVREICNGRTVASAQALRLLVEGEAPAELTPRQIEIVQLLAEGLSTQQIAERLFVESTTIKTHVGRVCQQLGLSGRHELLLAAPGLSARLERSGGARRAAARGANRATARPAA